MTETLQVFKHLKLLKRPPSPGCFRDLAGVVASQRLNTLPGINCRTKNRKLDHYWSNPILSETV